MRSSYLFTSESVSEGHPDKVSDQISDAIVDLMLSKDPQSRVACETLTTTQRVVLAGEIRCKPMYDESREDWATNGYWAPGAKEEIERAARQVVRDIGYEQAGFHWQTLEFRTTFTASRRTSRKGLMRAATRTRAPATRASCSASPATRRPT